MDTEDRPAVAARVPERRTSRKIQTMHRIQAEAMRLFLAKGYEATTVEEIAQAAGVSHMTVFRHFPTKEAIVLTDEYDPLIAAAIRQRPPSEPVLDSVQHAIAEVLSRIPEQDIELARQRTRLILATPALQASLWANTIDTHRLIADALVDRGGVPDTFSVQVMAAVASAVAAVALLRWIDSDGQEPVAALLERAFRAAREATAPSPTDV